MQEIFDVDIFFALCLIDPVPRIWGDALCFTRTGMVSNKIYVGNLKFSLKEENIRQIFSVYGVIQDLKMIHDRETGNFRGFAFITYANPEEAEEAVTQMNGQPVDGRNLKVTFAEDKRKEKQN